MPIRYRTVWISDTHLGSKGCRAEELTRFLKIIRCETLYLVGDIVDMWRLRQRWYWPNKHNDVVRHILKHAKRKRTKVIFIPGNHDDAARQFVHYEFGGVKLHRQAIHETIDGRKLLICHGDQFDLVVQHSRVLSMLGSVAYEWLLVINRVYNGVRMRVGRPYFSLSQAIKLRVKQACTFISRFEESLIGEAKRHQLDGVVCGHIHKAEVRETEQGITYYNCGDWVESCTALIEDFEGNIILIDGIELVEAYRAARGAQREAEAVAVPDAEGDADTLVVSDTPDAPEADVVLPPVAVPAHDETFERQPLYVS